MQEQGLHTDLDSQEYTRMPQVTSGVVLLDVSFSSYLSVVGQVVGTVHELLQGTARPIRALVAGGQLLRRGGPSIAHVQRGLPRGAPLHMPPLAEVSRHGPISYSRLPLPVGVPLPDYDVFSPSGVGFVKISNQSPGVMSWRVYHKGRNGKLPRVSKSGSHAGECIVGAAVGLATLLANQAGWKLTKHQHPDIYHSRGQAQSVYLHKALDSNLTSSQVVPEGMAEGRGRKRKEDWRS
ncbi:hypothetical protein F7725_008207 [Dissostichus mawsoni]|uniref:Uncharacterized protein n=1 Tax=Dissostichus mawsoni TaxID=36200 RepID=A0A7J5Y6J0_DISMA|nr:hypothetical protein F7725_008207 [Dissostichus mawsoni]